MIWIKGNWYILVLMIAVTFLFVRVVQLEERILEVEGVASEAFAEAQTIFKLNNN